MAGAEHQRHLQRRGVLDQRRHRHDIPGKKLGLRSCSRGVDDDTVGTGRLDDAFSADGKAQRSKSFSVVDHGFGVGAGNGDPNVGKRDRITETTEDLEHLGVKILRQAEALPSARIRIDHVDDARREVLQRRTVEIGERFGQSHQLGRGEVLVKNDAFGRRADQTRQGGRIASAARNRSVDRRRDEDPLTFNPTEIGVAHGDKFAVPQLLVISSSNEAKRLLSIKHMATPLPNREVSTLIHGRRREPHRDTAKLVDHAPKGEEVQLDIVIDPDVEVRRHRLDQQWCPTDERRGVDLLHRDPSVRDLNEEISRERKRPCLPTDRVDPKDGNRIGETVATWIDLPPKGGWVVGIKPKRRVDTDNQKVDRLR